MTKQLMHRLFVALLLPTILLLSYNYSVNWHVHRLDTGSLISHAHPYDQGTLPGESIPEHQHNSVQLLVLDQIFHLLTIALIVVFVSALVKRSQFVIKLVKQKTQTVAAWCPVPQLRGPPRLG
ncbi:MAG: hypothetical protein KAH17_02310 [Bacteroidales bacterium]|nr:hypothetical protein [Bacteroidales bacterium]